MNKEEETQPEKKPNWVRRILSLYPKSFLVLFVLINMNDGYNVIKNLA